ncbi:MAG: CoA pyrophosphatase [Bacteroidales bacterium]|nr:CoA pyrophosphatase [Bacteroidales bacterium]
MVFIGTSMIDQLVSHLNMRLKDDLPGRLAQLRMAPSERHINNTNTVSLPPRMSSVLILIFPLHGEPAIVLMRRTLVGLHAGQISLPGGKKEDDDLSGAETALRESEEEIGVDPEQVTIVGSLSKLYVAHSNFIIHPFIGYMDIEPQFMPNPEEVEEVIVIKISDLFRDDRKKRHYVKRGSEQFEAPYYDVHGHIVWGATAMILSEFEELVK